MKHDDQRTGKLNAAIIAASLDTQWLGRVHHYFPEIDSTNEHLQQLAAAGAPAGTMVITDYQRKGRGRLQRRWEAPPGSSLLFSLLLLPAWSVRQAQWLTMIAALSVAEAVRAHSRLTVGVKWPNDIVVRHEDGWRKTCGLLLATTLQADHVAHAVIGIGLNVNIPAEDMPKTDSPATSLLVAGGRELDRIALLADILRQIERRYLLAEQGNSPQLEWHEQLITLGQEVQVTMGDRVIHGEATGTGPWGELYVRDETGVSHAVVAGDVTLRESEA